MAELRCVVIDRCGRCPYRKREKVVADGTVDVCLKSGRNLDYRACVSKGEFPQGCPLPIYIKVVAHETEH